MRRYYPSLNCYPTPYPELSNQLLAMLIANAGAWLAPGDIYATCSDFGENRARNALRILCEFSFVRRDARGYQLAIPAEEASVLFAYHETPTQRVIMADIIRHGFVYAHQFRLAGKGDATQFLRAVRALESQGVIESSVTPVPNIPKITRRTYTLTNRAKKHG